MNEQRKFTAHMIGFFSKPCRQLLCFYGVNGFKLLGQFTSHSDQAIAQARQRQGQSFNAVWRFEQHHCTRLAAQGFNGALSLGCFGRQETCEDKTTFAGHAGSAEQGGHTAGTR